MSAHHPFTLPTEDSAAELEGDLSKVRAVAYDIVLNGYELGGGSLRINHKDLQERMLKALGFSEESAYEQFGFLLEAMDYGSHHMVVWLSVSTASSSFLQVKIISVK